MKTIDQLSIFLENKTGRLAEIAGILAEADISIRTLELVEAGDFGLLRIIVPEPDKVKRLLHDKGITAKITPVIAIEIEDATGCFYRVIETLSAEGIDISYTYTINNGPKGTFVLKTDISDIPLAVEMLEKNGARVLDAIR